MCGIAFVMKKDGRPAIKQLIKAYEKQKSRGQEGFGYVAFTDGEIDDVFRSATETGIYTSLKKLDSKGILFHHRMPTSTPNFKEGAHPIYVSNARLKYDYYVVHNGVIRNDTFLKEKHEKLGYKYTTEMFKEEVWTTRDETYKEKDRVVQFNDSEALAIEVAEAIENGKDSVDAYGSIAFICMQVEKASPDDNVKIINIFFGRNTNPLNLEDNDHFLKLTSEGGRYEITPHTLYGYNMETKKLTIRNCIFGSTFTSGKTWKEGDLVNGEWVPGHYVDDPVKTQQSLLPARRDADDDFDELPGFRARNYEDIETKLDREVIADTGYENDNRDFLDEEKYESCLTGEETLAELKKMQVQGEKLFSDYIADGNEAEANRLFPYIEEIGQAIDDWKFNLAGQVENPPKYNKNGHEKK